MYENGYKNQPCSNEWISSFSSSKATSVFMWLIVLLSGWKQMWQDLLFPWMHTHLNLLHMIHHINLQLATALLKSSHLCPQFLIVSLCSYQGWWSTISTQGIRCVLKSIVFVYFKFGVFFWLIFIFIINTTRASVRSKIQLWIEAVTKSFSFKHLDQFNWRVINTTREMGYIQDKHCCQ